MLEVRSVHRLEEMETVLRRVLQRHGMVLHTVSHLGHVLQERDRASVQDAFCYSICHADLYQALLSADIRFAAFLPCRLAAWTQGGAVTLQALPLKEACRILNRPDLEPVAAPFDNLLAEVLDEASRPLTESAQAGQGVQPQSLGATEDHINVRASIPQRIDCRGTKVEDLAGTGSHDSSGG